MASARGNFCLDTCLVSVWIPFCQEEKTPPQEEDCSQPVQSLVLLVTPSYAVGSLSCPVAAESKVARQKYHCVGGGGVGGGACCQEIRR